MIITIRINSSKAIK